MLNTSILHVSQKAAFAKVIIHLVLAHKRNLYCNEVCPKKLAFLRKFSK